MSDAAHLCETRQAYDLVAPDYAELLRDHLATQPWDQVMLARFADQVATDQVGPVGDLGCGPGRVTSHLHQLGLDVFGMDLSPAMVAVARAQFPDLSFVEGSLLALDVEDGTLGGIVAWYSIIHTPLHDLPGIFAEFARVLAPGGSILLAFQVGDNEAVALRHAYGHDLRLDAYRLSPVYIIDLLAAAGLVIEARLLRQPEPPETTPQAYLIGRKPPGTPVDRAGP